MIYRWYTFVFADFEYFLKHSSGAFQENLTEYECDVKFTFARSDNIKVYIPDRKEELSKRKSTSDYIRALILFGFVYTGDMAEMKAIMDEVWKKIAIICLSIMILIMMKKGYE